MRTSNRRHTDLAELIRSLKSTERDAVRKALDERKPRPALKQLQLFDYVCEQPEASDKQLLAVGIAPNKNALHQLRYALYDAILEVLRVLKRSPKHVELVERLLQQEKLLFERHMFGLGLRTLNRARHYAEKYGLTEELTRIHKRLQDEYRFLANTDERLKRQLLPIVKSDLRDFRKRVATQYERQKQEIFSLQVYWQLEENGRPSSETDLHRMSRFYQTESPPPPGNAADMHAVLHYHNNWAHLAMLQANWATAMQHTKRAWEAMLPPDQLRERSTEEVFSAVVLTSNYLMVSAYVLSFSEYNNLDTQISQWTKNMHLDDAPASILHFQRYLSQLRCATINALYESAESVYRRFHSKEPTDWGHSKMVHARQVPFYEAMAVWGCAQPDIALKRLAFYQRHPSNADSAVLALGVLSLRLHLALEHDDSDAIDFVVRELIKLARQHPEHATVQCFSKPLLRSILEIYMQCYTVLNVLRQLISSSLRNLGEKQRRFFFPLPVLFEQAN